MWTDRRILELFGIELPVLQAPMAGASTPEMAINVAQAGGLGALPAAFYTPKALHLHLSQVQAATEKPINVNFFAHQPPEPDPVAQLKWRARLAPFYLEAGLDPVETPPNSNRAPFDADFCAVIEALRPQVISFHFGLPEAGLLARVRATGAKIISSATTVAEARWLAAHNVDAVIAMGAEAGGHRGTFLTDNIAAQPGTFALLPQVVDAVDVPVIAAGGIADGRTMAAALTLGAAAVQVGTAYLKCPEAAISPAHAKALAQAGDDSTVITNLFTGRPARGIQNRLIAEMGPLSAQVPAFPTAGGALTPLKAHAEAQGLGDFTALWAGQSAALARPMGAGALTKFLAQACKERLAAMKMRG